MTLHEAIKKLVAQFGESIVTEVRLANLLADLNGYQDYPAMKMVLKEFLKAGYGKKLFDIYSKDSQNAINKSVDFTKTFASVSNYKEDLISYASDCILFALGCITTINEPMTKGYDPYTKGDGDILGKALHGRWDGFTHFCFDFALQSKLCLLPSVKPRRALCT